MIIYSDKLMSENIPEIKSVFTMYKMHLIFIPKMEIKIYDNDISDSCGDTSFASMAKITVVQKFR